MTAQSLAIPLDLPVRDAAIPQAKSRLGLLDGARLLAAAGIVWVHVSSTEDGSNAYPHLYPLGVVGVPFYLFVAMLFMARGLTREPRKSLGAYFASRFLRVYVPFLGWSVVYAALTEVKFVLRDHHLEAQPWSILYAGGHQHLWFLPFLMIVSVIGAVLVRGLEFRPALRRITIGLLAAAGVACCFPDEPAWIATRGPYGDLEFWRFGFRALPTVCWSTALALGWTIHGSLPRTSRGLAGVGVVVLVGSLVAMSLLDPMHHPLRLFRAAAGLGLLLIALCPAGIGFIERIGGFGRYSYGIYLSHVVFVRIFVLWMQRYEYEPGTLFLLGEFVVVFGASLGLSILLSRSRYTRWMLGD